MAIAKNQEKQKSHWQYAKRYVDSENILKFHWFKGLIKPAHASHVSTAILNSDGSLSQTAFYLDFDFKRSALKWQKKDGKLDYEAIKTKLFEEFPFLEPWFMAGTLSSSGTGFHLVFAFPPYLIGDERFKKTEDVFHRIGTLLTRACQSLGFGVDPGAWGQNRLTMNWKNTLNQIEYHHAAVHRAWYGSSDRRFESGRCERENVLGEILKALRGHDLLRYKPKKEEWLKDDSDIIYPDKRVETKLAKLLIHLWEEHEGGPCSFTRTELCRKFSFNPDTLKKLFGLRLPCGLYIEDCGVELTVSWVAYSNKSGCYLARAYDVVASTALSQKSAEIIDTVDLIPLSQLPHPEDLDAVCEGMRNKWIVSACVWLKLSGMAQERVEQILANALPLLPGWESSPKSRDWKRRVASLYRNRVELCGALPNLDIPCWLLAFEFATHSPPSETPATTKKFKKVYPCEDGAGGEILSLASALSEEKESQIEIQRGGPGDPPPPAQVLNPTAFLDQPTAEVSSCVEKPGDGNVLDFLSKIVPKAVEKLELQKAGKLPERVQECELEKKEFPKSPQIHFKPPSQTRRRLKLSAQRRADFGDRDAFDRFWKFYNRALWRKSETFVINVLVEAEKRYGYLSKPIIPPGRFRRLLKAFFVMPSPQRRWILHDLIEG